MLRIAVQHRRFWFAAMLVLVTSLSLTLAATQGTANPVIPTKEPWPPFVMVYERQVLHDDAKSTNVVKLEYTDRRHWRATVLEEPSAPDREGTTWTFNGNTMTYHDARYGFTRESTYRPDQQPLMNEWLGPGRLEMLEQKPDARPVQVLRESQALLVQEQTYPDPHTNETIQWRREITFHTVDRIPTKMVSFRNGEETERWEVRELTVGSR